MTAAHCTWRTTQLAKCQVFHGRVDDSLEESVVVKKMKRRNREGRVAYQKRRREFKRADAGDIVVLYEVKL